MPDQNLNVRLNVSYSGTGTDQASKQIQGVSKTTASLSDGFAKFGLVMDGVKTAINMTIAPFKAIWNSLDGMASAFEVLDRESNRLNASLSGLTDSNADQVLRRIEINSQRTGIATDDLNQLYSDLNINMRDASMTMNALESVMDTSARTGKSNEQVIKAIETATTGRTKALSVLLGKSEDELEHIKDASGEQERQALIIEELERAHKGARLEVNKGIASWKTLKNSFGDLVEEAGKAIFENQTFQRVLQGVSVAFRVLVRNMGAIFKIMGEYLGVVMGTTNANIEMKDVVLTVIDVFGFFGEIVIRSIAAVRVLANVIESVLVVAIGVAMAPIVGFIRLQLGLVEVFTGVIDTIMGLARKIPSALLPGWMESAIDGVASFVSKANDTVSNLNDKIDATVSTLVKGAGKDIADILKPLNEADIAVDKLNERLAIMKTEALQDITALKELEDIEIKVTNTTGTMTDSVDKLGGSMGVAKGRALELAMELEKIRIAQNTMDFSIEEIHPGFAAAQIVPEAKAIDDVNKAMDRTNANAIALVENANSIGRTFEEVGKSAAQVFHFQFATMFTTLLDGSKSFGQALLDTLLMTIQTLAAQFAQLFVGVALGFQAAATLGPFGLFAAAAVLTGLAITAKSIMGSGGNQQAPPQSSIAPVSNALRREADEAPTGGLTVIMNGVAMDEEGASKSIVRALRRAKQLGLKV